jgi:hypothetical protein
MSKKIIYFLFLGLLIAYFLELELWSRWIYWDDVSSFVNTLHLSLFGLVVVYDLLKKNTSYILEGFLYFKEQLSEPLFGHKGPVASIISAMIYYFGVGPFLIMVSFFIIWILIYCMISFVVSILLFTPFFDRTIESRDFMVIEQHVSSSGKGRSHRTVFKEVNGTLKANIDNKDFYRQVKTGSHLKITGTNTSVGFVYKIKDIEVLKD